MSEKKVLHIVESFGSGVFSFLTDLVRETSDEFEICIAYGKRAETPENFEDYFDKKVRFVEVKNFGRSINPVSDLKAFFEVKKIIKAEDPDIVHLHSSKAGFVGRFAANCKKRRVIYNPHGFSFLMLDSSALKRRLYHMIEKLGTLNRATVVGCSQGEYEEARKLTKRSVCISNGLNIQAAAKLESELEAHTFNAESPSVCTCARIGAQKMPAVFNSIAQSLKDLSFLWIGDGELKTELTSENISVSGWVDKSQAVRLENDCDIFMLTSAWEGLPIALLEAMYLKKLCIVSDCIGNRDVIKNGVNGFVCKDKQEFVEAVNRVREMSSQEVEKITAAARRDVEENYNLRKNVREKYINLYLDK